MMSKAEKMRHSLVDTSSTTKAKTKAYPNPKAEAKAKANPKANKANDKNTADCRYHSPFCLSLTS